MQGEFETYLNKLFQSHKLDDETFISIAKDVEMDVEEFIECLSSGRTKAKVKEDVDEGRKLGVRVTPTFWVGEVKVEGAYPVEYFQKLIDAQLKDKEKEEVVEEGEVEEKVDEEHISSQLSTSNTIPQPSIKLTVIYDPKCEPCKNSMKAVIERFQTQLSGRLSIEYLNYRDEKAREFIEKLDIKALPAYVLSLIHI